MALAEVCDLLCCPRCQSSVSLSDDQRVLRCDRGHSFDVAKQGYVNLTGARQPKNADTSAMLAARRRTFARGLFAPVADLVADLVQALPAHPEASVAGPRVRARFGIADCGAGPGYYLARTLDAVPAGRGLACDVSVAATRAAAACHRRAGAVVTDLWQPLPIRTGSIEVVLNVFAPRNPVEFHRILAPGAALITVTPTIGHLHQIRRSLNLLSMAPAKEQRLQESLGRYFARCASTEVSSTEVWDRSTVADLVAMGPNAFHLSPDELAEQVRSLPLESELTVAVRLTHWAARV